MGKKSQKKAAAVPKGSKFPTKLFLTVSFLISGIVIYADVEQNGSWKASRTYNILKETGLNEYGCKIVNQTKQSVSWVNSQIERQYPGFEKQAAEFTEPYVDLAKDLGIMSSNLFSNVRASVIKNYPLVMKSVETHGPAFVEKFQSATLTAYGTIKNSTIDGINYLKNEVFVGQLSPENMLDVSAKMLKGAQQKVYEGYLWISEKISLVIK